MGKRSSPSQVPTVYIKDKSLRVLVISFLRSFVITWINIYSADEQIMWQIDVFCINIYIPAELCNLCPQCRLLILFYINLPLHAHFQLGLWLHYIRPNWSSTPWNNRMWKESLKLHILGGLTYEYGQIFQGIRQNHLKLPCFHYVNNIDFLFHNICKYINSNDLN